ncbi:hypothetical protein BU16DRAFT_461096 [Lophium mytilinum]|uniref:Zn(2)-C6 fungal-type domain-containing protein n=1 Tax=Lophium mytilinum TaxID=390894 RepID=A0A6A6QSK0_9PEZI|nr:hypothetical protein BU16DRAFT_461096 [Lophium mytilinum]
MPTSAEIENQQPGALGSLQRPKRHQVARACDWCRAYRIKCDARSPCRNCDSSGRQCSSTGANQIRTFATATREIERLKLQIQELQLQVTYQHPTEKDEGSSRPLTLSKSTRSLPTYLDPYREHGGNWRHWECYYSPSENSQQRICYGPASAAYFIGRLNTHLKSVLPPSQNNEYMQLDLTSTRGYPELPNEPTAFLAPGSTGTERLSETSLSRAQEESLLDSFWQTYHLSYPILDKDEFLSHLDSLWAPLGTRRQPSALVDIVLALCIQHGASNLPSGTLEGFKNASYTDHALYHRSSSLLGDQLEEPSLASVATLQCQILSVVYLSNASRPNTANIALATAIRTAIVLGFHRDPPQGTSMEEEQTRKRIFWTLYAFEMDTVMQLGRPLAVNMSQVTCSLPKMEENTLTSKTDSSLNRMKTCYAFNLQFIKLVLAARSTYVSFYHKCADVLKQHDQDSLYNNAEGLEACAEFLSQKMEYLYNWSYNVPEALKYTRKSAEELLPTARPSLGRLQTPTPWLERERILLDLRYHNFAMNLFRPFICFSEIATMTVPFTTSNANACLFHARIITETLLQALTESELLHGRHEIFRLQWNAAISLVGYLTAYPGSDASHTCRDSINYALQAFEVLSSSFPAARRAINVTRELLSRVGPPKGSRTIINDELAPDNAALFIEYPDLAHDAIAQELGLGPSPLSMPAEVNEWAAQLRPLGHAPGHSLDFLDMMSFEEPRAFNTWDFELDDELSRI